MKHNTKIEERFLHFHGCVKAEVKSYLVFHLSCVFASSFMFCIKRVVEPKEVGVLLTHRLKF